MARALMICGSRFRRMQGIIRAVAGAALSRRIFCGDEGYVGRRCFAVTVREQDCYQLWFRQLGYYGYF